MKEKLLLFRGGLHKEFAYKTFFKKEVELIIMDTISNSQYPFADYQYLIPNNSSTDIFFDAAMEIHESIGFSGAGTFMNSPIPALGRLSDCLGLNYLSENSANILSSKLTMREFLCNKNLDTTAHCKVTTLEELKVASDLLQYPFVLKPTDTASGVGVSVIQSSNDLKNAFEEAMVYSNNNILLAEQFILGTEYCAEVIAIDGEVFVLAISQKILSEDGHCIELMDITPAPINLHTKAVIEEYFIDVVMALEIKNLLIHVEFRMKDDSDKPMIIEINPRAAGGNLLESIYHLKGLNPYDLLFDVMLKRNIDIKRLREDIEKPFDGYSLFYSFLSPDGSGKIKAISGENNVMKYIKHCGEKIDLYCKVGQQLLEPISNLDFRGSIYLFGEDLNELVHRAKRIETNIDIQL